MQTRIDPHTVRQGSDKQGCIMLSVALTRHQVALLSEWYTVNQDHKVQRLVNYSFCHGLIALDTSRTNSLDGELLLNHHGKHRDLGAGVNADPSLDLNRYRL